jgi:hypothetical protein
MERELHIAQDGAGQPIVWSHGLEPDWSRPIAFLIHGYNVEPRGAAAAYARLFDTIRRVTLLPPLLDARSWLVYWAGYESGGLAPGKTLVSPLTYAAQIPSACDAARGLRDYIDRRSGGQAQVSLIAHSLGCRVALELLDAYAAFPTESTPEFPVLVLMAAAVPTHFLEDLQRLWRGALLPKRVIVLFSERDAILAGPFRLGQTIAGEGLLPRAVGATGRPVGFWTRVVRTRNGHSGYFGDLGAGAEIARAFGNAPPSNLPVFDREARIAIDPPRGLPASSLPSRVPGGVRTL